MIGSSVIFGETSKETIVREELDIDINANELIFITRFKLGTLWVDTYILRHNYDIEKMRFQKYEVTDAKWMTLEEIDNLANKGNFMEYRWEFVSEFISKEIKHSQIDSKNRPFIVD